MKENEMKASSQAQRAPGWPDRLAPLAVALVLGGPLLAWLRWVPALGGFYAYAIGGLLAIALTLAVIVRTLRGRGVHPGGLAALLCAAVFTWTAAQGSDGPSINDFSTDLNEPPVFVQAPGLAPNAGRDFAYDPEFAPQQRECCSDLKPMDLALSPQPAFALALAAARQMPHWNIVEQDSAAGRLEAVAETPIFGFRDDIAIRVRPTAAGSRIDVRSKSRDGRGDLGANARRIRNYMAKVTSISS